MGSQVFDNENNLHEILRTTLLLYQLSLMFLNPNLYKILIRRKKWKIHELT